MEDVVLKNDLKKLLANLKMDEVLEKFYLRIEQGKLTKSENPQDHFCVYFGAIDQSAKKVFLGLHKKSGLWLFNGGHIEIAETSWNALEREIKEEWGLEMKQLKYVFSSLLTITNIDNPTKQTCKRHYDLWFFVHCNEKYFSPNHKCLDDEFYEYGWYSISSAKQIVKDDSTRKALDLIATRFF